MKSKNSMLSVYLSVFCFGGALECLVMAFYLFPEGVWEYKILSFFLFLIGGIVILKFWQKASIQYKAVFIGISLQGLFSLQLFCHLWPVAFPFKFFTSKFFHTASINMSPYFSETTISPPSSMEAVAIRLLDLVVVMIVCVLIANWYSNRKSV